MAIQNLPASQRPEVSDPSIRERNAVLESHIGAIQDKFQGIDAVTEPKRSEDADSFSEHSFLESNRTEEEEVAGFANDNGFVKLLVEGIERSKRKRKRSSSDDLDDDDAALISCDPFYQERKKKTSDPFDDTFSFMEPPRLKSTSVHVSKLHSTDDQHTSEEHIQEEEEKQGFWLDSVRSNREGFGDHGDPSSSSPSSNEEIAALCLFQLSRGHHKRLSQSQLQRKPHTEQQSQIPLQPQPQTHIQLPKVDLYKCSLCGKEFPSYHALGGHKASNRIKPPQTLVENASADDGDKKQAKTFLPSGNIHKCSICHTVFRTGQSLGGHKRSHYQGVLKHSQDEDVSKGDKLSTSCSGSVVTNASDPEQRLNKEPSPEFD